ncbi:MAG: RNB domain-containing ribonuclease, partial [Clostridia bacterium]|nr:RNB domain-containing ribonuclease [Clostridia bacterium]
MYIKNVKGVYLVNKNGFGFVRPFVFGDESAGFDNSDIFIPPTQTGGAFNGDVVLCNAKSVGDIRNNYAGDGAVFVHASCEFMYAGKITSVEKRLKDTVVGNVIVSGKKVYLMPDDYVPGRVLLSGDGVPVSEGDKILARIKSISSEGVVKAVAEQNLGNSKEFEPNLKAIKLSDSIGMDFSKEAENQSEKFCMEHVSRFANRRLDLRGRTLFTMEGFGKYAYSCAFSVEINPDGNYVLGVHVPDVAHYIPEDSALDKEAAKRGRSCSIMGKVYPMIPKELIEKKLSLKKGIDVLAVSFLLTIDPAGNVIDRFFAETIINVSANCTNSEMEALLLNADTSALSDVRLLYKPVQHILDRAYALGAILQNARIQRGGLDIDEYKSRFVYVEKDEVPVELKRVLQNDPNRLVNEFYLVCEKTIGEYFYEQGIPT